MITIDGQKYEVLDSYQITVKGDVRTEFKLKKPKGRHRVYHAVLYSNNQWSRVI